MAGAPARPGRHRAAARGGPRPALRRRRRPRPGRRGVARRCRRPARCAARAAARRCAPGRRARGGGVRGAPAGGGRAVADRSAAVGRRGARHPRLRPRRSRPRGTPRVSRSLTAPVTADAAREALAAVRAEVAKAVVAQDGAVTGLVVALLCRGHALLEGVPGVAKTLLVRTLAQALHLETKRLQFTPDLMPSDVTGSLVYDSRAAQFSFRPGPVFTNLLLADEINRTPPKTQASLLKAMEERQVSVEGA